ncbi:MAG: DUF6364 family protein [Bacteroidia bacterium]|jgi:hypothetical protein
MTSKLTLSIDREVIQRAKEYAHKTGRSLSDLIESYLESIVQSDKESDPTQMPPKLKRLFGSTHIATNLDHKKEIRKILSSKDKR